MDHQNQEPLVPDMLYRHDDEAAEAPMDAIPGEPVEIFPTEESAEPFLPEAPVNIFPAEESNMPPLFEEPVIEEAPLAEAPAADAVEPLPESFYPPADIPDVPFTPDYPVEAPAPAAPQSAPEPSIQELFDAIACDDASQPWEGNMPLFPEESAPEETALPLTPSAPEPAENPLLQPEEVYETFLPEEGAHTPDPVDTLFGEELVEQSAQEETPEVKRKKTPPVKKGRPRRKKGDGFLGIPHLLATVLWLAVIVAIGTSLGKLLWVGAADVLAFGRENKSVTVTIVESDDIDSIALKLSEAGLVRYPSLFKFYATLTGSDEKITTGTFQLDTILDYHALTSALSPSSASRAVVKVTIPEGFNCRQIFKLLADSNVCSVDSLEEYAATGELGEYWFLENVERGDKYCLEGFLFPDTYEFYENSTPREALVRMLNGFEHRFSEELIAQIDALNAHLAELMADDGKSEEYIASHVYTVREVVIVASLIEKETAGSSESATIASVIYNRLFHWGDYPAYLNIDASILYVVDGDTSAFSTSIDSPFNTYRNTGLTPTPIANPGLTSIQAALNPESTGYYFYVLNPDTGLHQFSATQEEHDAWIDKFRSGGDEE